MESNVKSLEQMIGVKQPLGDAPLTKRNKA